jgi:opacity protein-like surface antigen
MPNGEAVREKPTNMNANLKTLAIAACLAIGTSSYAQGVFIRPELSYNFASLSGSNSDGFKVQDALGYGVAGGTRFGTQEESEFGLSVATLKFSLTSNVVGAGVSASGNVKVVPIMANYRYYFGTKSDVARPYFAPSAGWTNIKTSTAVVSGLTTSSSSSSGNCFTWAAGVGLLVKLDDKLDMDLGYRYIGGLKVRNTNVKMTVGSFCAGMNFRF